MIRKIIFLFFFSPFFIFAQIAGNDGFSFINMEISPRVEAMGGSVIAIYDNDLSIAQTTPSLLNSMMHNNIVFAYTDYVSDINLIGFSYARFVKKYGTVSFSVKAINYGEFDLNDEYGNKTGIFSVNDQVFTFGIGRRIHNRLSIGANINFLNSQYASYSAIAIASNCAITYINQKNQLQSTLLFKNIGRQIDLYAAERESLPFEIQIGLSKKLTYLPFRYHLTYTKLDQYDIKSPYRLHTQTNLETGDLDLKEETIAKTLLRHVVIGGELNPFRKQLFLRGGFNFQRRFDMNLSNHLSFTGFSFGLGIKLYDFDVDYSRSSYHVSGYPNNFSIVINLSTFGI